jgi:hypothetical protein
MSLDVAMMSRYPRLPVAKIFMVNDVIIAGGVAIFARGTQRCAMDGSAVVEEQPCGCRMGAFSGHLDRGHIHKWIHRFFQNWRKANRNTMVLSELFLRLLGLSQ